MDLFSPQAATVHRQLLAPAVETVQPVEGGVPSVEDFYRHAVAFGPDEVYETAARYLSPHDLLKLALRVDDVIGLAYRGKRSAEPSTVTSYRARIAEARARGTQALWLARMKVKKAGGADPRVKLCLALAARGETTRIIASRCDRSVGWVRKTIRDQKLAVAV
jgi:hypothetical protein